MLKKVSPLRFFVFALAVTISICLYLYLSFSIPEPRLFYIRLVQSYAFCAIILLYLALLISPLYSFFPKLPYRAQAIIARRAIGVSTFYFACLHGYFAFFQLLGGFEGWNFLSIRYQIPVLIALTVLILLSLMTATSFDFMMAKLGKNWKRLHRLIYIGGLLIIIHFMMLGTHFADISGWIPQVFADALILLLTLEAFRFDKFIFIKYPDKKYLRVILVIFYIIIGVTLFYLFTLEGLANFNYQSHG